MNETLKGWVYVATLENTGNAYGLVKVGRCSKNPEEAIAEWAKERPGDACLTYAAWVENPREFESRVRLKISEYRKSGWWSCNVRIAVRATRSSGTILYEDDRSDRWWPESKSTEGFRGSEEDWEMDNRPAPLGNCTVIRSESTEEVNETEEDWEMDDRPVLGNCTNIGRQ